MNAELSNLSAVVPEATLLAGACAVMVFDLFSTRASRAGTLVLSLLVLLVVAVPLALQNTATAPSYAFGGMYVSDGMAGLLKVFTAICAAAVLLYSAAYARARDLWRGELFSLVLFSTLGVFVMISANNLLVIYLGLELQSLSLYALTALRRDEARATEAAMKYFVLGALASGFLLYGMSMLYGASGSLDINVIAHHIASGDIPGIGATALACVFIVAGIAFKMGAAPFHMWVPDVYQGAPTPVTLFIGSAPKIGAFAMAFRLLAEALPGQSEQWGQMLTVLAVGSLAIGNLAAIAQSNLKRMLGYSTIAQMGFMLLAMRAAVVASGAGAAGIAVQASAWSAAMFYVITYALTTLGTFGTILLLSRKGFEAEEIADLRGLNKRDPWFAFVMLVLMFSLAGVPPTVGFYAKWVVLIALIGQGNSLAIGLAIFAVMMSLIGAYYYLRVVKTMYFDEPAGSDAIEADQTTRIALSLNAVFVLVLGLLPQFLINACGSAMLHSLGG